jgi:uncharacterized protein with NAD-binding domain and iron-sulfur cluster
MRKQAVSVAIVGGGVAGLSAAHELAERGFEVDVYERRCYFGGKAASVRIGAHSPHASGPRGLPGEHGFRFFPGWYRHLPDTMKRIPYRDKTVDQNLVAADMNLLVDYDRDPIRALVRLPTSAQELMTAARLPAELLRLGLTVDDLLFFFGKLATFLRSSEERRLQEFDNQTWWEFMEADSRSQAFRDYLVVSATRTTVAAKPTCASAYTIAKCVLLTLLDTARPWNVFDRVLNGPTNEVWIDPWRDYLGGLGVRFHTDAELDSIELDGRNIRALRFVRRHHVRLARAAYLAAAAVASESARLAEELDQLLELVQSAPLGEQSSDGQTFQTIVDQTWPSLPDGFLESSGVSGWAAKRTVALQRLAGQPLPRALRADLRAQVRRRQQEYRQIAETADEAELDARHQRLCETEAAATFEARADHYLFALPVEQMAYYVQRSETLQRLDPRLKNIVLLSEHVDWMAGIQFYLRDVVNITRGHIDLLDSEWALTAVSQLQFWKDVNLQAMADDPDPEARRQAQEVRSILSVDISAWDRKGRLRPKEAYNCTPQELAEEVWCQLKRSLNRPGRAAVLRDESLLGWGEGKPVPPRSSYYVDDSIVDKMDRKKQAVYDKFRTVRFSAAELVRRQSNRKGALEPVYRHGERMLLNAEPLLINRVGSWALRPGVKTEVHNMFLAADYVRTHTNVATMEAANEAARAAVNEILLVTGSHERPCPIWPPAETPAVLEPLLQVVRELDGVLFRRGQQLQDTYADIPIRLAAGAATAATRLAERTFLKLINRGR